MLGEIPSCSWVSVSYVPHKISVRCIGGGGGARCVRCEKKGTCFLREKNNIQSTSYALGKTFMYLVMAFRLKVAFEGSGFDYSNFTIVFLVFLIFINVFIFLLCTFVIFDIRDYAQIIGENILLCSVDFPAFLAGKRSALLPLFARLRSFSARQRGKTRFFV